MGDTTTKLPRSFSVNHGQGYHFGKPVPELPREQECYKAAATVREHKGWDPTVGRQDKAEYRNLALSNSRYIDRGKLLRW